MAEVGGKLYKPGETGRANTYVFLAKEIVLNEEFARQLSQAVAALDTQQSFNLVIAAQKITQAGDFWFAPFFYKGSTHPLPQTAQVSLVADSYDGAGGPIYFSGPFQAKDLTLVVRNLGPARLIAAGATGPDGGDGGNGGNANGTGNGGAGGPGGNGGPGGPGGAITVLYQNLTSPDALQTINNGGFGGRGGRGGLGGLSFKGLPGHKGPDGPNGANGADGKDGQTVLQQLDETAWQQQAAAQLGSLYSTWLNL